MHHIYYKNVYHRCKSSLLRGLHNIKDITQTMHMTFLGPVLTLRVQGKTRRPVPPSIQTLKWYHNLYQWICPSSPPGRSRERRGGETLAAGLRAPPPPSFSELVRSSFLRLCHVCSFFFRFFFAEKLLLLLLCKVPGDFKIAKTSS